MWNRNGGALHFAETMAKKFVRSRVSAKFFTWLMGILFHQGGTISTVLTGTTVRPVADKHKVAHEELAYVVDSTASPVATVIPFNVWPIYIAGLISVESMNHIVASEAEAISLFYQAIPYNFYALVAFIILILPTTNPPASIPRNKAKITFREIKQMNIVITAGRSDQIP